MMLLRRLVCRLAGHRAPASETRFMGTSSPLRRTGGIGSTAMYVELRCPRCQRVRGGHRTNRAERRRLAEAGGR